MVARARLIPAAAAGALLLLGCSNPRRCGNGTALVEVRDGAGVLERAVRPAANPPLAERFDICDGGGMRVGTFILDKDGTYVELRGTNEGAQLRLSRTAPANANAGTPRRPSLRVHQQGGEARVLHPDGVPYGSVMKTTEGATVFSPAGQPIATAAVDGQRAQVRATDGRVLHIVTPAASATAAAALALEGLSSEERLALYLYWSR